MKALKMVLLVLVIFVCVPVFSVFGEEPKKDEEPKVTGSGSVGVYNQYIFRGYEIGRSGLVVQPSLTASYKGFSATFWGNLDTNQRSTKSADFSAESKAFKKGWNETDLTLSYTYAFDKLSLTGGYIYYGTKYADETEELFATIAYDIISKPSLSSLSGYHELQGHLSQPFFCTFDPDCESNDPRSGRFLRLFYRRERLLEDL